MTKQLKTRDRIILAARHLFNEQRFGTVSTAAIAAEIGIAEGNLWYHFRNKRALLDAISNEFAQAIEVRLAMRPAPQSNVIEAYVEWLGSVLREFTAYRFLYRDRADYGEHSPVVLDHIAEWFDRTHEQLRAYLGAMIDQGLLDWPPSRLADLCTNALIILRYGLEFQREADPLVKGTLAEGRWTVERQLSLFEDRLDPAAARRFHRAIEKAELEPVA